MPIDLNSLKDQIQTIFETANTTTAAVDLSAGLPAGARVARVLKVNPARIPVQSTWYPFVSVYVDSKDIELLDVAANQRMGKRKGTVAVKVIGAVWNSSISDDDEDPADEDCESLMENVENILRDNPTLNGIATWVTPTKVTYHNATLDEGNCVRAGILSLDVSVHY